MFYLSQEKYLSLLKKAQEKNASRERKHKIEEEKNKYKSKLKLPSASKLILLVVILLCIEIVFFCQYAMIKTSDVSALYAMIGVPVSLVPVVLGYYFKSKAENTSGGIVYETTMAQMNQMTNCGEPSDMGSEEAQG